MEVTLEITNFCEHDCEYCSTRSTGDEMVAQELTIGRVKQFLEEVGGKYHISRINISGGEPLSHPYFYDILKICKKYTENVWVYTNAITQIMYNTDIVKEIKVEANVCLTPGKSVYIPEHADMVHLLQLIPQGRAENMNPAKFHVSSNIVERGYCDHHNCSDCDHTLLQADNKVVEAPCKKDY